MLPIGSIFFLLIDAPFKLVSSSLTHLSRMDFLTVFSWTSPFPFEGLLGCIFHFHSIFNRTVCQQTVQTLIRRRVLRRLVWVCTICLCPTKRTLSLNELNHTLEAFINCL